MKFLKSDLLTLLMSLFVFGACEKSATIGLEVDPGIAIDANLTDTITISSRTVADNIGEAFILTRHPFGSLKDPVFGLSESSLAMSVSLISNGYKFGASPVLDSAVLVLNYGIGFYGDSTSIYDVEVHQLLEDLSNQTSFLSNKTYAYQPTLLGAKKGRIYPNTRYRVLDIVTSGKDTTRMVTPQMRIKLDDKFIQNNIVNLSDDIMKYNGAFKQSFKGLHVQINKSNSTGKGGIMFFDFGSNNSYLSLYYRRKNADDASKTDSVGVNFPISIKLTSSPVVAGITHDYTGTPIAAQLASPTKQFPVTYLQPMGGVRTKLDFPYLKDFAKNIGKIAINKAELVIDVNNGTDVWPYYSAPRLALYRYDIAGQRGKITDNDVATQKYAGDPRSIPSNSFGGYYNYFKKQYIFVVTAYIQDLIDGKTENYGTFLAPTASDEFSYLSSSYSSAARSVIGAYKKNPSTGEPLMKLHIYYTKIN